MHTKVPIIGVVGHKNSGKTTVVEGIIQGLTKRGYRVTTAKHVSQKGFSMNIKGKDTWRHSTAGANPVVSVSDAETAVLIKNGEAKFSPDQLFRFTHEIDAILLEGFSSLVLDDENVGKILCIRDRKEYEDYSEKVKGEVIAFCSCRPLGKPILRIKEDFQILVGLVLRYIRRKRKILEILSLLPRIDCRKCGYLTCKEMAVAIYRKKAKLDDCVTLRLKSELKTKITFNDAEVPIQAFVSEIIHKSLLGMVSTLKGVSISGNESVEIRISTKG